MKKLIMLVAAAAFVFAAPPAFAATKTYQVTGPVLELTPDKIVVQKGAEKWELALGSVSVPPTVKVGSKVTIEYTMAAATLVEKAEKPAKAKK
jgi:hypothetical protein